MNEFLRGILFAVCMATYGYGMYVLGRHKERELTTEFLNGISDELEKSIKETKEELKKAGYES